MFNYFSKMISNFFFFFPKSSLRFLFFAQAANLQDFRSKLWLFFHKISLSSAARVMSFFGQVLSVRIRCFYLYV